VLFPGQDAEPRERPLGPAPAAEDQAADREAEAEGAERKRAERDDFARPTESLPTPERLLLLARERLAAPLLPYRAARSEPEIEVVEDLGRLIDHGLSV
jgi:hypothetical protein